MEKKKIELWKIRLLISLVSLLIINGVFYLGFGGLIYSRNIYQSYGWITMAFLHLFVSILAILLGFCVGNEEEKKDKRAVRK